MMVLTTLRVCLLLNATRTTSHDSLVCKSIRLGLMALCVAMLSGCPGGNSDDNLLAANAKNGNGVHPTISLSPINLAYSVTQGDANPDHTVNISNTGNGPLRWSVSTTTLWLMLSPSSGTSSGNSPTAFTATANLSGLPAGTYSAIITVSGDGATNNPQGIPVTLIISPLTSSTSTSTTTTSTSTSTSSTSTTTTSTTSTTIASVALGWDGETDPGVTGYYVHYGPQSPNLAGSCAYTQSIYYSLASLANASSPRANISGLTTGTTYYFAVSAYNGKLESPCSNEVSKAT